MVESEQRGKGRQTFRPVSRYAASKVPVCVCVFAIFLYFNAAESGSNGNTLQPGVWTLFWFKKKKKANGDIASGEARCFSSICCFFSCFRCRKIK